MKKIYLLIFTALLGAAVGFSQPQAYLWKGGSGDYGDANMWDPPRMAEDPSDTLIFFGNEVDSVKNIPNGSQTGALWILDSAQVVFTSSGNWNTFTIVGGNMWDGGGDFTGYFDIEIYKHSSLTIAGEKPLIINLAAGKTTFRNGCYVDSSFIELKDTAHKILVSTVTGQMKGNTPPPNNQMGYAFIEFGPTSQFNMNYSTGIDSVCSPFVMTDGQGIVGYLSRVFFDSGSTFNHLKGVGPHVYSLVGYAFADPSASFCVLDTGSTYLCKANLSSGNNYTSFNGKKFGSVVIDNPNISGVYFLGIASAARHTLNIVDSLVIKNGVIGWGTVFASQSNGIVSIGKGIHVYSGAQLNFGSSDTTTTTKVDSIYLRANDGKIFKINNEGTFFTAASTSCKVIVDVPSGVKVRPLNKPLILINPAMQTTASFDVESGATLTFDSTSSSADSAIKGNGVFNLKAGATIEITSKDGITQSPVAKGNIQTANRNFDQAANYIYNRNRTGTQSTGDALGQLCVGGMPTPDAPLVGNLEINLGASANQPLTLSAPVSIGDGSSGGTFTLTRGYLQTDGTNLLTIHSDVMINGGSATSYVSGPLKMVPDNGFPTLTFPIGKDGIFGKVGLINIGGVGGGQEFTAEYFHNAYSDVSNVNAPLNHVSHLEYWTITPSISMNGTIAGNAQVQLFSNSSTVSQITDLSTLRVAHYNGAKWDNVGNTATSGSLPGSVSVTSNSINTFSPFTFATTSNTNNPLPLTLISFNGKTLNGVNSLYWESARELNVARFDIERSSNGISFVNLGTVKAFGTTDFNKYNFNDTKTPEGVSYYRLRIFDKDGTSKLSGIIALNNKKNNNQIITVFPNPVKDVAFVTLQAPTSSYSIELNQMNGQRVKSKQIDVSGITNTSLDLTDVPAGTYMMVLRNNEGIKAIQRVVKQ